MNNNKETINNSADVTTMHPSDLAFFKEQIKHMPAIDEDYFRYVCSIGKAEQAGHLFAISLGDEEKKTYVEMKGKINDSLLLMQWLKERFPLARVIPKFDTYVFLEGLDNY